MSSRGGERGWECMDFVIRPSGLQAVMELAEELVEQMALGLVVPVALGSACVEVAACAGRGAQRGERPDLAGGSQALVLDVSVQNDLFAAAGAGDRRRACV